MTAMERVRVALEEHDCRVTGTGDQLAARCPAHDDGSPSLSLTSGDRRALLHCHAGCTTAEVLAALNLKDADLFDEPLPKAERATRQETHYEYRNADGQVVGRVTRRYPKKFVQSHPDGRGGWVWKASNDLKVTPYRLPELLAAISRRETVYVVEGEKDVHTLASRGAVATCNAGGAGKWTEAHAKHLHGADVVVVRDNDDSGRSHADKVLLTLADVATSMRLVDVAEGCKDVTDHLSAGYGLRDLREVKLADGALSEPWDIPLPVGWRTGLPAFPVDALPMVLSEYVQAISDEIQTPPDMAGTVVLGVQAAAIGGRVRVRVRSGWVEPTNLYAVPVADPASRKSAVVAECRKPLAVAEAQLREQVGGTIANLRTQREILDEYAQKLKGMAARDGSPTAVAKAQEAVRAAEEVKVPAWPRLVTSDATPEVLVTLLAEQGGRIAAISAEAGIFDSLTGRYGNKPNLEKILEAHAGDEMLVDRRSRTPERVERPALTLIASIQPYALREMVKREDFAGRGLLARVLWSLVPDNVGTRAWDVTPAPEAVKLAYRTLVVDLAVGLADLAEPVELRFDGRAYEVLGEYAMRVEKLIHPDGELGTGLPRQWAGKLTGAVVRIAGCLHAAGDKDALGNPYGGIKPKPIGEGTIRSAIRLGEYYRAHADAALSPGQDKRTNAALAVLSVLVKKEMHSFRLRELMRRVPRALQKAEILSESLDYLASLGWVRSDGKGYELHPDAEKLLTALTDPNESEVSAGQAAAGSDEKVSAPPLTGADSAVIAASGDSFVSTVSSTADSFTDTENTDLPAQTREVSALSAVSAGVRALPDVNGSGPRHAQFESDALCRDCRKPTAPWVMATRDGRCITCAQDHREAS